MITKRMIPIVVCWLSLLLGWQTGLAQNSFELTFDRANSTDNGKATIELANGNVLIAGTTENGINANSGTDGFLTVMNPETGLTIWSRAYGWDNDDAFHTVIQASDSTIVVVGFANEVSGNSDMWFLRLDRTGNVLASSTFNNTSRSNITEIIESDVLDSLTGEPTFLVTGPSVGFTEFYLARLDFNGGRMWEKRYTNNPSPSWAYALEEVPGSNDIYLVGSFVIRLESDGTLDRATRYASTTPGSFNWIFDDAWLRPNGNLIATGTFHLGQNVSGDTRPMWIEINTNSGDIVTTSFVYNTTSGFVHRMNNFQPHFDDQGALLGFIGNISNNEGTGANRRSKIAYLNTDGTVASYLTLEDNTIGTKVFPFRDGSIALIGTRTDNQAYLVKTDTFMNLDCADTTSLDTTNIIMSETSWALGDQTKTTTFNDSLPLSDSLIWNTLSSCCDSTIVEIDKDTVTICLGDSVKLTAKGRSTFNQLVYLWSTGEDTPMITVAPEITTNYVVTIIDTITQCESMDTVTIIIHPRANFTLNQIPTCPGNNIEIEATGDGAVLMPYSWSPNPNVITTLVTGEIATYSNINVGTIVYVESIDTFGCIVEDSVQITAHPLPTINIMGSEMELCDGENSTITASSSDGTVQLWYVENTGAETSITNSYLLNHVTNNVNPIPTIVNSNGMSIYMFVGEVFDSLGCTTRDTILVRGSNLTTTLISNNNVLCEGESIDFLGSATGGFRSNGNPYQFDWSENGNVLTTSQGILIGGNPITETNNFNYSPANAGSGLVDLIVTDSWGCVANVSIPYMVNARPNVTISTTEDTVCLEEEVTLSVSPNNAVAYDWTPNTLGNTATVTTTINQLGSNLFSVAVTNTNGCQDSTTIDVRGVSCCQVTQNSEAYLRLDPDNPDTRLADYGITRFSNSRFYIINTNNEYNRFPEQIYLADEVTLFVRGTGNTMDVTNADVVFGRNSGIYIETGNEMIANNTVFRPCDETQTWDGIVVTGNEATANFRECTFINPTFGVYYNSTSNGAVSGSLFLNAQHGVISRGLLGTISNNVFRVDDNAKDLIYSELSSFGNNGAQLVLGNHYNDYISRYNIHHSGVFALSNFNDTSNFIISQNEFVNGMSLGVNNPTFNGVLLPEVVGINVSDNSFTNNDVSVLVHYSQDISIENNHMEVTRRSTSDESFYQIVTFGPDNQASPNAVTALIKGNTIINSADQQELTPNVLFETSATTTIGVLGTGAIYNYGNNRTRDGAAKVRIEDNDISGFEIGIYAERSNKITLQIVNNRIQASIYGIYQNASNSFIGCNEIEMDLDANVVPNAGVVGIRSNLNGNALGRLVGVSGIFGNCVRNTDRAIFMESQQTENIGWIHIQNNYLYNYTEAGLYTQNFFNVAGNNENRIRRNAFISNQLNGDPNPTTGGLGTGAFDIVTDNLHGTTVALGQRTFVIDGNYFGEKSLMNSLQLGTAPFVISTTTGAPELRPFTACGNMDATDGIFYPVIEADWMNRCDDENYANSSSPIAQRIGTETQLNATYQSALTDLMATDQPQAEGVIISHLQSLTDLVDVEALYLTAQQFSLSTKTSNWIEYYYQERKGNHVAAQQVLNNMTTETRLEAEEVTIKKAHLSMAINSTRSLTDATLIAELKAIAVHPLGVYKHTAREILHNSTNESYTFQYNPVKLYTKPTSVGTRTQVGNNADIRISPNPATDKITINIISDKSVEWTSAELYDIHGRLLLSQPVRAYSLSFDLETLAQGVYVVALKGEDGYQTTEKFVKQ